MQFPVCTFFVIQHLKLIRFEQTDLMSYCRSMLINLFHLCFLQNCDSSKFECTLGPVIGILCTSHIYPLGTVKLEPLLINFFGKQFDVCVQL